MVIGDKVRLTGRTFRAVLKALTLASEGHHVIYECSSHNMARWTFYKALATSEPFINKDAHSFLKLNIGEGSVRFTRFLSDHEHDEARGGFKIIRDF